MLLGPADVADDELAAFAAASLGTRHATVLTSSAKVFPYDRPAITTAGRYLVTGTARTCATGCRTASPSPAPPPSGTSAPIRPRCGWSTCRPAGSSGTPDGTPGRHTC
jgi:hypothetical protein